MQVATSGAVGRIVAASLAELRVECFELEGAPPLGALVAVAEQNPAVYGVVSSVTTEGVDPSRPVSPHGTADEDLGTVLSRNPHLPVLLRTTQRWSSASRRVAPCATICLTLRRA